MLIEIKIPGVGESVTEALLAQWFKNDGDLVKKDEPLFVIETDKVTLEVVAEADGVLAITVAEGEMVAIGAVVGTLDSDGVARAVAPAGGRGPDDPAPAEPAKPVESEQPPPETAEPAKPEEPEQPPPEPAGSVPAPEAAPAPREPALSTAGELSLAPSVRRLVAEKNLDPTLIPGTGPGGRITKGDVVLYLESAPSPDSVPRPDSPAVPAAAPVDSEPAIPVSAAEAVSRKPMSPIRQRIAARLLEAMHIPADVGVVRASFVHYNSEAEIAHLLASLAEIID